MSSIKILVAQGGGPTAVINQSLVGVVLEARRFPQVTRVYGALHGVRGIVNQELVDLGHETSDNLAAVARTPAAALGSTRDKPDAKYCQEIFKVLKAHAIDTFFYIGGNDSSDTVRIVSEEAKKGGHELRAIHIPKTIDNDLVGFDHVPGFPSAARFVAQAFAGANLDNQALKGVYCAVVMGRHAGWIATHAGIAGGADAILVPERPFDIDEVCARLRRRHERGRSFSIVVAAEGATPREGTSQTREDTSTDAFGHARLGGIGVMLEHEIEARTGFETRVTILGHVQRGGTPVAFDRVLATRFGVAAMEAVAAGRFGTMVALRGTEIVEVDLEEALREPKLLDPALYETAELFFG